MKSVLCFVLILVGSGFSELPKKLPSECGHPYIREARVNRSALVSGDELPWHVGIYKPMFLHGSALSCEGVLIHERYVLTAAGCVVGDVGGNFLYKVRSGDFDIEGYPHEDYKVRRKIVHENFAQAPGLGYVNDIALLELTEAVKFKEHILPICLPSKGAVFVRENATATGWGPINGSAILEVPRLHKSEAQVIESESCSSWFVSDDKGIGGPESSLCVRLRGKATGPCRVGSPLILEKNGRYQVIGITSGEPSMRCRESKLPSFYTNVSNYVHWINANIEHERDPKVESDGAKELDGSEISLEELEDSLKEVVAGLFAGFAVLLLLSGVLVFTIVKLVHYTEVTEQLKRDFDAVSDEPPVYFTRNQNLMSTISNIRNYGIAAAANPYE